MEGNIARAEPSPRIDVGVIKWYEGDVFELQIQVDLVDQDDEPVSVENQGSVEVNVYDKKKRLVRQFAYSGGEMPNNTLTIHMTEEVSADFPKGLYTYDIIYHHSGGTTTVARGNPLKVE